MKRLADLIFLIAIAMLLAAFGAMLGEPDEVAHSGQHQACCWEVA